MPSNIEVDNTLNVQRELEVFSRLLKRKGMKITEQRMLVAEKIFKTHEHFTAEEITDYLKEQQMNVSKATVYRILSILVESDLILEHDFGHSYKVYEHCLGHDHHDHLICVECGTIIEFHNEEIEKLQEEVAAKNNFTINHHHLNIFGTCANCQSGSQKV